MDRHTKEQRSFNMAQVRVCDTDIELILQKIIRSLWKIKRYRKNVKNLPGKPDIVFPKSKIVIFADGDFWHGKDFKKWKRKISPFWQKKIASNMERDGKQNKALKKQGYRVLRFWGSYIKKNPEKVIGKIQKNINQKEG